MPNYKYKLALSTLASLALCSYSATAATPAEMKACEIFVLNKPKFIDLPMASISAYPGKDANLVHWTIKWDGITADGGCRMKKNGRVDHIRVNHLHDKRRGRNEKQEKEVTDDLYGFYYDYHVNVWRDPQGRECHTCTAENGFPDRSGGKHHGYHYSDDDFERQMQKDISNMLSDEDIANLNALTGN